MGAKSNAQDHIGTTNDSIHTTGDMSTQTEAEESPRTVVSGEALIKDLRKEDKRKIADLIQQLVRAGEVLLVRAASVKSTALAALVFLG